MFDLITKFSAYLEHISILTYPIALFLGCMSGVATLSCCFPLVPAIAGFVINRKKDNQRLSVILLLVMLGSIVMLVALGVMVSLVGLNLQKVLGHYWAYCIGAVCMLLGLFLLGLMRLPVTITNTATHKVGRASPFIFGLILGGTMGFGSSCCLPVLPVVLTYAAVQGRPLHGALIMAVFAVGQNVPLLAVALFSNVLNKFPTNWLKYIKYGMGVLLLLTGTYVIWKGL